MTEVPLVAVVLGSAVILGAAYLTYGKLLVRLFRIDPKAQTPAVTQQDGADFVPIAPKFLMGQHFSAIAAAGPIVGPIAAGVAFGWGPALAWILIGSIFIGGVHDFAALVASIRHKACSIAEVVREHMTKRSYLLFLSFIWLALVYIVVAFTDITAASFVRPIELENGEVVTGAGIATSSMLYLALPIVMGVLMRYARLSLGWATVIFLPLVGVAIWVGQLPGAGFDVAAIIQSWRPEMSGEAAVTAAHKSWDVALLAYCLVAGALPMWLLLQPRGHLGGYFLYVALAAAALGILFGGDHAQFPVYRGWEAANGDLLAPMLFITIACGACSGFHALIASGTTSKQLRCEPDAKVIGYGTMLLEGLVAVVSLCCVMKLSVDSELLKNPRPNFIYALGIGSLMESIRVPGTNWHVPGTFAVSFALMAFTTFVYDTLDVCTRLGRYIIQELTGWHGAAGRWFGTAVTAGTPLFFVMQTATGPNGAPIPIWQEYWSLFGASNQLLAALTLLGVTVWLWQTRREAWVWPVIGVPTVLMYVMSTWALVASIKSRATRAGTPESTGEWLARLADPVNVVGLVLLALAALMLVEAVLVLARGSRPPSHPTAAAPAV